MIDINTIINTAISTAVNQAIQPIRAHYDAQLEALQKEITELKQQRAVSPATGEGLAKDVVQDLLENNPTIKQAVYEIAYEAGQAVLNEHAEAYDHDEYDSTVTAVNDANLDSLPDFDEFVTEDDLSDAVRESVRETLENRVSVSLYLS